MKINRDMVQTEDPEFIVIYIPNKECIFKTDWKC